MSGTLAFASAIGFPDRIGQLFDDLEKNESLGPRFDAELVCGPGTVCWSAPPWCRPGDVCFFYCTTNWPMRIRRLRAKTIESRRWRTNGEPASEQDRSDLDDLLESAEELFRRIGGRVFAVGEVCAMPERQRAARKSERMRGRVYVDIKRVTPLEPALSREVTTHCIAPRPRATITYVDARSATELVNEIDKEHGAPIWLRQKGFGRTELAQITLENWKTCVAHEGFRAINESELREALIDRLASALSGDECWHAECGCQSETKSCGVADYMVPLAGKWLPIEAKFQMAESREALEQMSRYLQSVRFSPRTGPSRGEAFAGAVHRVGLIVDSDGVYAADAEGLVDCSPGRPLIPRSALPQYSDSELRERILSLE